MKNVSSIRSLALFYSIYYAKAWLTSTFAVEAPLQDLACIKALEEESTAKGTWPEGLQTIAKTALDKLKLHSSVTWLIAVLKKQCVVLS